MPKEEWGVKRVCPTTGKRFYDLNKNPIVSPYTGQVVPIDDGSKSRVMVADKADKQNPANQVDDEDDVLEDDEDTDIDLDDDLLDEDDDEDNVSLDDLTDVAGDDEEN
ncbi:TIGR02300 family protein [Pseudoruegeria sp. SHC-113]|uniref:TIGR02300 family protein n=1 Tax=Pseudoruegeria sp. SHC-113 TaxID=2855439 RepID=UPI0021BB152F|nr:TIGR02300 family protein [Pseudoruegeria sp. SHC-113]MCT8161283.1 TIGR02300 family protein [Pseudoruegeria sp. SHC-113]